MLGVKTFLQSVCVIFILSVKGTGCINVIRNSRQATSSGGCVLPPHPASGKWNVKSSSNVQYKPGDTVDSFTTLEVRCNERFKLHGQPWILCDTGQWSNATGTCERTCPPLRNTPLITFTCKSKGYEVDCSEATSNTIATFKCADYHEDEAREHSIKSRICRGGFWDRSAPNCVPECGQKSPPAETLIVSGSLAAKGDYPWHAALYISGKDGKIKYLCGGSLINVKSILTAAHCVTKRQSGQVMEPEKFVVGVGKHYQDYNHPGDPDAQFSRVTKIFVHEDYRGEIRRYQADIAILVTQDNFKLSRRVQPVCLDRNGKVERKVTGSSLINGTVIGWGFTQQEGAASDELQEINVPYVPQTDCERSLPDGFQSYLTPDKICAGYSQKDIGVCKGDSGGGLIFKHQDERYYILGIVSLAPPSKSGYCDTQQYGLYTRVYIYNDFIILREDIKTTSCISAGGKRTSCGYEEFQCTSCDCIPLKHVCDGEPQCQDTSDEDPKICGFAPSTHPPQELSENRVKPPPTPVTTPSTIEDLGDSIIIDGAHWYNNLALGEVNPSDELLYSKDHRLSFQFLSRVSDTAAYVGNKTITRIEVQDRWRDGTGGNVRIVNGGINYKYVTIQMISQRNRGFHFLAQIWGH